MQCVIVVFTDHTQLLFAIVYHRLQSSTLSFNKNLNLLTRRVCYSFQLFFLLRMADSIICSLKYRVKYGYCPYMYMICIFTLF